MIGLPGITPAPQQRPTQGMNMGMGIVPAPRMQQPVPAQRMPQAQGVMGVAQQMQMANQRRGPMSVSPQQQMALSLVDNDVENLGLDDKLVAGMKLAEANELLQSANQVLAPTEAPVISQLMASVPQDAAMVASQLQSGPMGGGMAGMPAPNMNRMADGGIVGYAKGDLIVGPPEQDRSLLQKVRQGVGQGMMDMGSNMQESDQIIRSKIPFIKQMLDKGPALTPQERAELKAEVEQDPGLIGMFGKQLERLGIYVKGMVGGGIVSFVKGGKTGFPDLSGDGKITRKDILIGSGVIDKKEGGIIGYAGPEGSFVTDREVYGDQLLVADEVTDEDVYGDQLVEQVTDIVADRRDTVDAVPMPERSADQLALEEVALGQAQRNVEDEVAAVNRRFDEETELTKARADQRAAEQRRRELRDSRFDDKQQLRRELRAGLLGTAERGLGGFGKGVMEEQDAIYAERLAAAEQDVTVMDKITATYQQLGLSKFEAEQRARKNVQDGIGRGLTAGAALVNAQRTAENAFANRQTQARVTQRGQDVQVDVAEIYGRRGSETNEASFVKDYVLAKRDAGSEKNDAQLRVEAVREYKSITGLITAGGRDAAAGADFFTEANEAWEMSTGNMSAMGGWRNTPLGQEFFDKNTSAARKIEIKNEFFRDFATQGRAFIQQFGGVASGADAGSAGGNPIPVGTVRNGFRYLGGNPNNRTSWEAL